MSYSRAIQVEIRSVQLFQLRYLRLKLHANIIHQTGQIGQFLNKTDKTNAVV